MIKYLLYRFFLSLAIANVVLEWNFIFHFQSRFPGEEGHCPYESKVCRHRQDKALSCPKGNGSRLEAQGTRQEQTNEVYPLFMPYALRPMPHALCPFGRQVIEL
jgi:hypothetical protein